jgi:hypothetical protein
LIRALALAAVVAAAPAAWAFGPDDAGIFAVFDKQGKETDILYRFYIVKDKWVAEERAGDGSWRPFECKADCDILPMSAADVTRVFGKGLELFNPLCLASGTFALCSYTQKANPALGGYLMMVNSPKGHVLLHIARIEKL